jgi:hypothetical protein
MGYGGTILIPRSPHGDLKLYSSPYIISETKWMRIRWTGRACSTHGEMRTVYRILVGNPKGRNHLRVIGLHERIILKLIL